MPLTDDEVNTLGSVLMGMLYDLSIQKKCTIASKAGLDISEVPSVQSNAVVNPALRAAFAKLDKQRKLKALPILAEQILKVSGSAESGDLVQLLQQHGYQFVGGAFLPVGLLDEREAHHLPQTSASELATAMSRLAKGEESAAITSACGAVDLATSAAYERYGLGTLPNSFQTRVNVVMEKLKIYEEIEQDLVAIGIKPIDANNIAKEMHETIKHAANALEVIRRTQADAHGTKPAYKRLAYDSVKWAAAICGLMEGKV